MRKALQTLLELRECNNWTQAHVVRLLFDAFRISVTQSQLSKYERGERQLSTNVLECLCELYGVHVTDVHVEPVMYQTKKFNAR